MNFSSLIHGDIGTIVCDSLLLHELSSLSRMSHSYHQLVEYKYSHMKYLDLGAYPNFSLQNFAHLCVRLRGIEILLIPLNYHMLVVPPPWSDQLSSTYPKFDHNQNGESTNMRGMREFLSLLRSNSMTMRVFRLYRAAIDSGDPLQDSNTSYLYKGQHSRLITAFFSQCARPLMYPRLEVIELLSSAGFTKWLLSGRGPFKTEKFLSQIEKMKSEAEAMSIQLAGWWKVLIRLAQVFSSLPVLTTDESHHYEELADKAMSSVSGGKLKVSSKSQLRVLPSEQAVNITKLRRWVKRMPYIEAFDLTLNLEENSSSSSSSSTNNKGSSPSGAIIFLRLPDEPIHIQLWSNLLSLRIMDVSGFVDQRIELRLPQLLQLILYDKDHTIEDFFFECPRLIALRVCVSCRSSWKVNNRLGIKSEESEHQPILTTPPSLFTSLRSSPLIRNFNCRRVNIHTIRIDYSQYLTQNEMQQIREKANSLGCGELSEDGVDQQIYCARLFYYALSLLPCSSKLEMIEFAPDHISLNEYVALFPHLRSVSQVPSWFESPIWYRPPEEEDEGHYCYQQKRIMKEYSQRANRMYTRKETNELIQRDHPPLAIFNLCTAEVKLNPATIVKLSTTPLLIGLRSLFLSAPTGIESSCVISQLFLSCQQLEHVSLMQLEGIDNTVFTQLPADCVRLSLVTLRIKTPCGVEPSKTFNQDLLTRDLLPRLFPSLRHFDYLLVYFEFGSDESSLSLISECQSRLSDILEPLSGTAGSISCCSSSSSHASTVRLLWPSLSYLSVRMHRTLETEIPALNVSTAAGRLAAIFTRRFDGSLQSTNRSNNHDQDLNAPPCKVPTLAYFMVQLTPLPQSSEYWNLPHRSDPRRIQLAKDETASHDLPANKDSSHLRLFVVKEYTCFELHCPFHQQIIQQGLPAAGPA